MGKIKNVMLMLLLILFTFSAPAQAAKRIVVDQAAVIVNDKMMTMQELNEIVRLQEQDYRSRLKGQELENQLKNIIHYVLIL